MSNIIHLKRVEIDGFRDFENFSMDLEKSTCFIGLSGSGRNDILDFLITFDRSRRGFFSDDEFLHGRYIKFNLTYQDSSGKETSINNINMSELMKLGHSQLNRDHDSAFERLESFFCEMKGLREIPCLSNIEHNIDIESMESLVNSIMDSPNQILTSTHSLLFINFMTDEQAVKNVIYVYKDKHGHTQTIPFFSIPSIKEKLTVMGPGEAYVDTDLVKLIDEITQGDSHEK